MRTLTGNHLGLKGRFRVQILEGDRVVKSLPWQNNLILDQGLDGWAAHYTGNLFLACAAGTGSTAAAVGQTGLVAEVARTTTYVTGLNESSEERCRTVVVGSVVTMRRTYDFAPAGSPTTYAELGFSWSAAAGNNLFSRVVLGTPAAAVTGQKLRVTYELAVTCSPTSPADITPTITGWPIAPATVTDASQCWQVLGLTTVDTTGATIVPTNVCNEPSESGASLGGFVSPSSAALGSFNALGPDRSTNAGFAQLVPDAYVPGSFERTRVVVIDGDTANRTDLRSVGIYQGALLADGPTAANIGFAVLFDEPQTKEVDFLLTLRFRYTWGRTP